MSLRLTNQNHAARAVPQQTVLTREQVGELYENWVCVFGANPGSAEICIREIEAAVLSALRAPVVVDEAAPDLRPHLGWALNVIGANMKKLGAKYGAASEALKAAYSAPQVLAGPDLRPHLKWALRRIYARVNSPGLSQRYGAARAAFNAAIDAREDAGR